MDSTESRFGSEKMVLWVKCLLDKYENLCLNPQNPHEARHGSIHL